MGPAVLANLVGRVHVYPLARAQPLHQLPPEIGTASVIVALGVQLTQPLTRATQNKLAQAHALTAPAQGVESLMDRRRLGDRMARKSGRHAPECSTRCSTGLATAA